MKNNDFNITVFPGDGIGHEIMDSCLQVLSELEQGRKNFQLNLNILEAGAEFFQKSGKDILPETFEQARSSDAVLLGAMGLPNIRLHDGTEIAPHLRMRTEFGLFAGVRPVKSYINVPKVLSNPDAGRIDIIILRESTEGLFAHRERGTIQEDMIARDTLEITRPVCEKLFDFAFELARKRKSDGFPGRVTCVDKANVFRSMAFFRRIFSERSEHFKDIETNYRYVDAMALDLVRKPWDYDILVMENMFGDILSDLGAGVVGGMGMTPCGEIGLSHALFQPAHGSAPDIAGTGKANPTAMLISAAMMLEWLGSKYSVSECINEAKRLRIAIEEGYAEQDFLPYEFGGSSSCRQITENIINRLKN